MSEIWRGFSSGVVGAVRAFVGLLKVFFVYLPCIVLLSLPAMLAGYCWCWIVGGFRAGELAFSSGTERYGAWRYTIELRQQEAGADHE